MANAKFKASREAASQGGTEVTTELETLVMCEISDSELQKMRGPVPLAVQVRQRLNNEGFRFVDDGTFSSIANENPEPLGKLTCWYDVETRTTFFRQQLST